MYRQYFLPTFRQVQVITTWQFHTMNHLQRRKKQLQQLSLWLVDGEENPRMNHARIVVGQASIPHADLVLSLDANVEHAPTVTMGKCNEHTSRISEKRKRARQDNKRDKVHEECCGDSSAYRDSSAYCDSSDVCDSSALLSVDKYTYCILPHRRLIYWCLQHQVTSRNTRCSKRN